MGPGAGRRRGEPARRRSCSRRPGRRTRSRPTAASTAARARRGTPRSGCARRCVRRAATPSDGRPRTPASERAPVGACSPTRLLAERERVRTPSGRGRAARAPVGVGAGPAGERPGGVRAAPAPTGAGRAVAAGPPRHPVPRLGRGLVRRGLPGRRRRAARAPTTSPRRLDLDEQALREAFQATEWADRSPVAVEVDVETPVDGYVLRSRIDAVFADPAARRGRDGVVVVDWKTGRTAEGRREPGRPRAPARRLPARVVALDRHPARPGPRGVLLRRLRARPSTRSGCSTRPRSPRCCGRRRPARRCRLRVRPAPPGRAPTGGAPRQRARARTVRVVGRQDAAGSPTSRRSTSTGSGRRTGRERRATGPGRGSGAGARSRAGCAGRRSSAPRVDQLGPALLVEAVQARGAEDAPGRVTVVPAGRPPRSRALCRPPQATERSVTPAATRPRRPGLARVVVEVLEHGDGVVDDLGVLRCARRRAATGPARARRRAARGRPGAGR